MEIYWKPVFDNLRKNLSLFYLATLWALNVFLPFVSTETTVFRVRKHSGILILPKWQRKNTTRTYAQATGLLHAPPGAKTLDALIQGKGDWICFLSRRFILIRSDRVRRGSICGTDLFPTS